MAAAYVHQPYPAWRFHPEHPARLVTTEQDAAALAAEGWVESPADIKAPTTDEPAAVPVMPAEHPPAEMPEPVEDAHSPDGDPDFSPQALALFATPGGQVATEIMGSDDVESIEATRDLEVTNPKYEGGRKTVLRAIEMRLALLKG